MDIDPRQDVTVTSHRKNGAALSASNLFFSGAPPPCTIQAMQQPQGDLVTLLRSECSPVLISGHINFPTSYILLRDRPLQHLRLTPVLMTLTAICSINTVFFDIVFTCRVL